MTVPVSGEDQPAQQEYGHVCQRDVMEDWGRAYPGIVQDRHEDRARILLMRADAADRAAGIRRVTEQFTRQQMWAAWDDGYEAARNGQQKRNPHRAPVAAPVPVQEDRP